MPQSGQSEVSPAFGLVFGGKMIAAREYGSPMTSRPISQPSATVFVVDDDVSVLESIELLLRHEGLEVEIFKSAQEFLARPRSLVPSCLILDVSLPALNG